jgi:hypothetical protein
MHRTFSLLVLLFFIQPVSAHHSMTEYDMGSVTELQGEISSLNWRNPHIELTLSVKDANGTETLWEVEAQDVNSMARRGLLAGLVNVGDNIRIAGNASMRRTQAISITNLLLPNGTEIRTRGNPEPRWETEENIGFGEVNVEQVLAEADLEAGRAQGLFRVWMRAEIGGFAQELPLTDSALAHQERWTEADDPTIQCIDSGIPAAIRLSPPHPMELSERQDGSITYHIELFDVVRTIYMNSDAAPLDQPASARGYSAGHWEDDVLVVNTSRINWPYFDHMAKIPLSESVELQETFKLNGDGTQMTYELLVTDPSNFTETVSANWLMNWRPDMEIQAYNCIPPE